MTDALVSDSGLTVRPVHTYDRGHSHGPEWTAVAMCSGCRRTAAVNPDTGTPWTPLGDDGETVVEDAKERFSDRYDGTNHETALEAALEEAYLRGRMLGRLAERASLERQAERLEERAARSTASAAEKLAEHPGHQGALSELRDACRWSARASTLRRAAHYPA